MKYKLTFALVASLTSTAFAEFKAPLPEFKNEKQLAEWRAEKASQARNQGSVAEEVAFYTGKPYLNSSGGYAFKYRRYNPELARWTSEDPSGFPDGANCQIYAPTPTSGVDPSGLDTVTVTGTPDSSTTSGSNFNITVVDSAHQVGTSIQAKMVVSWSVSSGLSGWVVQHVTFNESAIYNDSDNSQWTPGSPTPSPYWEAWRVTSGSVSGGDQFQTLVFPESTHGRTSIIGKVDFYQDSVFSSTNSPAFWSTSAVGEANGLNATRSEPSWWSGTGFNHKLTMTWE